MSNNKRIGLTVFLFAAVVLILICSVIYYITKSFVFSVIYHWIFTLCGGILGAVLLGKALKDLVTASMKRMQCLCGLTLIAYGVLDTVRYALSGGVHSILFLPLWAPICFMIIMHHCAKDKGTDKKEKRKAAYILGIPLLLLSLSFEIMSFTDL